MKKLIILGVMTALMLSVSGCISDQEAPAASAKPAAPALVPAGTNVINGTSGNDTLNGTSGNDTINSGDGDNVINAGDGNDVINGGNGKDIIIAGKGDDFITSGKGNTTYIFRKGDGNDTITDLKDDNIIKLPDMGAENIQGLTRKGSDLLIQFQQSAQDKTSAGSILIKNYMAHPATFTLLFSNGTSWKLADKLTIY